MKRTVILQGSIVLLAWCLASPFAAAYNPPVDAAGPLVVEIEGPEAVTQTETPLPVRVLVENRGQQSVQGTVRLDVIDRWRVEPAGPIRFSVKPQETSAYEFKAVAGEGTFSAHYPIHARVDFQLDGKTYTAHPILILQTELPRPPRSVVPVEWKPLKLSSGVELALWRLPVRRAVVQVFGRPPQVMPVGWEGAESQSRASLSVGSQSPAGQTRQAIAIHPPWNEGRVGTMLVEFPLQLPPGKPLKLRFANAVTPTGQGDGVTFRVRVAPLDAPAGEFGRIVFDRHTDAKTWTPAEADLSPFAGQAVRLQLESHPGPKNDTGWDQSYWAEPTLIAGTPSSPPPFPPEDDAGSRVLGTIRQGEREYEVRIWPGSRGLLDAVIGFRQGDRRLYFRGFEVRVLGGRIDDARSPILLQEAKEEPCDAGCQVRHRFSGLSADFDLVGRLYVERGALRAKFHLENTPPPQPWSVVYLEDTAAGTWSRTAGQVYAGHGNVIRRPGAFRLSFDGHRLATSFVGFDFDGGFSLVQGVDVPPNDLQVDPESRHYSLHVPHASTLTFIPAENVWEGVKAWREVNGLKAAGGVEKLAGRFVFDLWGGRYGESHQQLQRAFRYGLTDAAVIWHNWQRWGYDYRLPDIYPANPLFGTHEELRQMADTCKQAGVLFAPHDNYIDFYPDAEGFSYEKQIAFQRDGTPVKAWLNEGRGARSYRYRADRVEPFLRRNLNLIRDGLAPDAYFIDVWSSICPYDYWTADGQFFTRAYTNRSWGEHFAWIRDFLGNDAPQISESGQDQLIGWLDGAQTNHLRVGTPVAGDRHGWCVWDVPCDDAERTPWFDAAHHDRFILHGAGYSGRYAGGLDPRLHGIYSDDYLATEVLTGHPTMVSRPFDRDVVRKYWLTQDLMRALALRTIENVEYSAGGVSDGDLHRQHIRWSGGGEVWVNRGQTDWNVAGRTLPQYGFFARVPTEGGTVEASIDRRDGIIVEEARSPERIYVNARRVVDERLPIRAAVEKCRLLDGRQFAIALNWQLDRPVPEGYLPFLHFVDQAGEILLQAHQDAAPFVPGRTGQIETTAVGWLPEELAEGTTYGLCMGFYRPDGGDRLKLAGPDDGTRRIRLGTIRVDLEEGRPAAMIWSPHEPQPDLWLGRQNAENKPIDFGPIVTSGGCRLSRDGEGLLIVPLPSDAGPKFAVRLHPAALPGRLPELTHVETIDEDGKASARSPVRREGDALLIECEPGVFGYRLTGE